MKNKAKEFIKSYLPGFILGVISAAVVVVYAETYFPSNQVTYDNIESGLTSSNVQGAIDELYNICFPKAGDQIIENGNLEKDPYECRYFFTGANPNNYITFNNESWRIISIECDGTIKIIRNDSIGNMVWNTSHGDYWSSPASLNTYLNETYYNDELNATARSQIVSKEWGVGTVIHSNNNLAEQINGENSKKWNGKIALVTASEYIRTNNNNNCKTFAAIENKTNCANYNWLYTRYAYYTLNPPSDFGFYAIYIRADGGLGGDDYTVKVRPVLYLSSNIKITGGDGTQNNPYTIE